jgi:hypothetical protein
MPTYVWQGAVSHYPNHGHAVEVLSRANRAPRTPLPSPCPLPHERENPVQHESRRQSQCAHASRSQEQCSPPTRAAHSQAEPQGCTDACHTFQEPQGIPEDAEGSQSASTLTPSRCPPPAAHTPCASRPSPRLSAASAQRPSAAARAPRKPVHTSQLLAGVCVCPALRRPTPRRAQKSRAEAQAHPDARHTFERCRQVHERPAACAHNSRR